MQLLHISQYMFVLLWQVHERVNDVQYDYKLLTLIYAFFNYMYACILFVYGRGSLSSIGVVSVVSNKAPFSPYPVLVFCLGISN